MVWADDVFGEGFLARLWEEQDQGYVRSQTHPEDPLLEIWNYTEKAVFDRHWNQVTLNARGLITYFHDGLELSIEARPFKKFFNYGEADSVVIPSSSLVYTTDKLDGSLGIMYTAPDGLPAIATRGSFQSDQAVHGTKVLRSKYLPWTAYVQDRWPEETFMFEIIYPENRIVVDYEGLDDLVLLGSQRIPDGLFFTPSVCMFDGPQAKSFGTMTLAEALAAPPRPGKEGMVLYQYESSDRVKLKQEEYLRLHKIVTGLNARAVWEFLKQGEDVQAFVQELPDEFQEWALEVEKELHDRWMGIVDQINRNYREISEHIGELTVKSTRKRFAELAVGTEYPWAMFSKLDGKDYTQKVWDLVKPGPDWTPHSKGLDTLG